MPNNNDLDLKLDELAQWFEENPKLPQEIDRLVLKRFLKCMNGDVEETKQLIELNYSLRNKYAHIFIDRDPEDENCIKTRKVADMVPLPGLTPEGHKLVFFRGNSHDPRDMNPIEETKIFFMIADCRFTMTDVNVQTEEGAKEHTNSKDEKEPTDDVAAAAKEPKASVAANAAVEPTDDSVAEAQEISDSLAADANEGQTDDLTAHAKEPKDVVAANDAVESSDNQVPDRFIDDMADGDVQIVDIGTMTMGHIARMSFITMRIYMRYLQEAYPVRLRALHVINCPSFLDKMIAIVRPFVHDEVYKMIHFHTNGLDSLYEHVPRDMLPDEYGGKAGKLDDLKAEWTQIMLDKREYLMDSKQWRIAQQEKRSRWLWW